MYVCDSICACLYKSESCNILSNYIMETFFYYVVDMLWIGRSILPGPWLRRGRPCSASSKSSTNGSLTRSFPASTMSLWCTWNWAGTFFVWLLARFGWDLGMGKLRSEIRIWIGWRVLPKKNGSSWWLEVQLRSPILERPGRARATITTLGSSARWDVVGGTIDICKGGWLPNLPTCARRCLYIYIYICAYTGELSTHGSYQCMYILLYIFIYIIYIYIYFYVQVYLEMYAIAICSRTHVLHLYDKWCWEGYIQTTCFGWPTDRPITLTSEIQRRYRTSGEIQLWKSIIFNLLLLQIQLLGCVSSIVYGISCHSWILGSRNCRIAPLLFDSLTHC